MTYASGATRLEQDRWYFLAATYDQKALQIYVNGKLDVLEEYNPFRYPDQPIFDGGRLRANVDRADAVRHEALAAWGSAVLNAFAEVETSLAAERLLATRESQLARAAEHAEAAEKIALDRYRSGLVDFMAVL